MELWEEYVGSASGTNKVPKLPLENQFIKWDTRTESQRDGRGNVIPL